MSSLHRIALASLLFGCSDATSTLPMDAATATDSEVQIDAQVEIDAEVGVDAEVFEDASADAGSIDSTPPIEPWARRLGGGPEFDNGNSLAVAPDGTFFTSGNHGGDITFEPSFGPYVERGMYLAAHDPDGSTRWIRSASGGDGKQVAAFADGSVVVVGWFGGSLLLGAGEAGETLLESAGTQDLFLARYSSEGDLVWAKRAGGPGLDFALGVSARADGTTILTGYFSESATFGEAPESRTLTTAGITDVFLAKYNRDGRLVFARRAGGPGADEANGIDVHPDGSIVITGRFNEEAIFGATEARETSLVSAGSDDIFVAKYDEHGLLVWAERSGGEGLLSSDQGNAVKAMADGSVIVTGQFESVAVFGEGEVNETVLGEVDRWTSWDVFVARYDAGGQLEWARRATGDDPEWDSGQALAMTADGSILVVGHFRATAVFGKGEPNETTLVGSGDFDIFLARYAPSGDLEWAHSIGGSEDDFAGGISVASDRILLNGSFRQTLQVPLLDGRSVTMVSTGLSDIFVAALAAP